MKPTTPRTRLAVLGTVAELHHEPLAYDLAALRRLVVELAPDLLCAEVTRAAWEGRDLSAAAVEVREALLPAESATDIVLVPVAPTPNRFGDFNPSVGWRQRLSWAFDRWLRWGERRANRPEVINGMWFGTFCHTLCALTETLWSAGDRTAWEAQNQLLAENVLDAVRRDPGRRVLVAVQCQRLHRLLPLFQARADEFDLVWYQAL